MSESKKLRVLLPHWIEHSGEHAKEFRRWAGRGGETEQLILAAADLVDEANERLREALQELGGPLGHDHSPGNLQDHNHGHD